MGAFLDPILISNTNIHIDSQVIDINRDISDHNATLVNIKIPCFIKKSYMRKVWNYKNADYTNLNQEISEFQWEEHLSQNTDVDTMSEQFLHKYLGMISRNIPSKMVRIRLTDKPWFNSELRRR